MEKKKDHTFKSPRNVHDMGKFRAYIFLLFVLFAVGAVGAIEVFLAVGGGDSVPGARTTLAGQQGNVRLVAAPVGDEGLADAEQHDGNLSNGEEAPDRGLLHEVGGDETGQGRAKGEEESALDHHALLLVQREERGEHAEGVDGSTRDHVARVGHGDGPSEVDHRLVLERAELLAAEPFRRLSWGGVHRVPLRDERHWVA